MHENADDQIFRGIQDREIPSIGATADPHNLYTHKRFHCVSKLFYYRAIPTIT